MSPLAYELRVPGPCTVSRSALGAWAAGVKFLVLVVLLGTEQAKQQRKACVGTRWQGQSDTWSVGCPASQTS